MKNDINENMLTAYLVIKICEEALFSAGSAYKSLRLLGDKNVLPGLASCEEKRKEALNIISQYLKQTDSKNHES